MKYFIIELRYLQPLEVVQQHTEAHRTFLRSLYDKQILLMSGPGVPRNRGILIGRAESEDEMRSILAGDPYQQNSLVEPHFIEFAPANYLPELAPWLGKEG